METVEILSTVSKLVYENVKDLAGTKEAIAGDFGRGAGGDISRNIDIIAEKTVIDYLKEINFDCVVLGEECLDGLDGWVLEVFDRTESGLLPVGMILEEEGAHLAPDEAFLVVDGAVLLLVDGLELGVEKPEHGIVETFGLDLGPVLEAV